MGMEEQLNSILQNPEAMGQIMSLAQSLSGGGEGQQKAPEKGETPAASPPPPDLTGLLSAITGGNENNSGNGSNGSSGNHGQGVLPEPDPRLLQIGMKIFQEYNRSDDKNRALLEALKPFLRPERVAKMDRAIQITRLSRVIRAAFAALKENGGIFRV